MSEEWFVSEDHHEEMRESLVTLVGICHKNPQVIRVFKLTDPCCLSDRVSIATPSPDNLSFQFRNGWIPYVICPNCNRRVNLAGKINHQIDFKHEVHCFVKGGLEKALEEVALYFEKHRMYHLPIIVIDR